MKAVLLWCIADFSAVYQPLAVTVTSPKTHNSISRRFNVLSCFTLNSNSAAINLVNRNAFQCSSILSLCGRFARVKWEELFLINKIYQRNPLFYFHLIQLLKNSDHRSTSRLVLHWMGCFIQMHPIEFKEKCHKIYYAC